MKRENMNENFFIGRIDSFKNAINGVPFILKEKNSWIHISASIITLIAAYCFQFQAFEWCILILSIAVILSLEGMNTAIEHLVDLVSPAQNDMAGRVKDISSGAVLLGAIGVVIIGIILFGRHLV